MNALFILFGLFILIIGGGFLVVATLSGDIALALIGLLLFSCGFMSLIFADQVYYYEILH